MSGKGKLLGIAARKARRAPMIEHARARITVERGVADDARGAPGRRQLTVLSRRAWELACAELGTEVLPWTARRANLFIDGIDLRGKVGYDLHIGAAVLSISGETTPCKRMDEARPGLRKALERDWRGGVTCRVIEPGDVSVGCEVALTRSVTRQLICLARERARTAVKGGLNLARRLVRVARKLGVLPQRGASQP